MVWSCNEDGGEAMAKGSIDLHTTKQEKKRKTDNTMENRKDVYKRQLYGSCPIFIFINIMSYTLNSLKIKM